ncbi:MULTISPECIES: helix-turn-helix transcriptional regulator [unclassified Kitasatospora]|uniref:helix-turn-helix transcriptional regulator n=1 Tax=unclassified Kitasatospora TaxID=2633591 RepID=UPI002476039D|nr:LuxR C-terminal-related transcriptional regulator [Kitasatospora sp. MAP12-44]
MIENGFSLDVPNDPEAPAAVLDPEDVRIYRFFLEISTSLESCLDSLDLEPSETRRRIVKLVSQHLLRPSLATPGGYEAAPPDLAVAELTAPLQVEAHRLMRHSDRTRRELGALGPIYRSQQRKQFASSTTEMLTESEKVRRRLTDLSGAVQNSVLAAHPTMGPPEALQAALELDRELLSRGVEYRSVVPHTARRQRDSFQHIISLQELGAQVRTAAVVPGRIILMDGSVAVVSVQGGGAALFRDPPVVDFLALIFEHIWDNARPVTGAEYEEGIFEEIELSILGELTRGRSDDFISRRLGISTRTLRRYLASMCGKLKVETRFQLGMAAARLNLADDADGPQ